MPAWGAVLIAAGFTFIGFLIDAARGTELTRAFAVFYLCGCVVALCAVRYRGMFTAVVQPPLLLFVAVPLAYQFFTGDSGSSIRDVLLNSAIELVNRFPLMLLATVVSVALGALRVYLARRGPAVAAPGQPRVTRSGGGSRLGRRTAIPPRQAAARQTPRQQQPPRQAPSPRRPVPPNTAAEMRRSRPAEMPAHPMPQARYRDREPLPHEG
ncbi:MAG TPA: DUF6542 domain-containing protein [Aldersonia sp.]